MRVRLHVYGFMHMSAAPEETRSHWISNWSYMQLWTTWCGCWESNCSPLEELTSAEPSLQPVMEHFIFHLSTLCVKDCAEFCVSAKIVSCGWTCLKKLSVERYTYMCRLFFLKIYIKFPFLIRQVKHSGSSEERRHSICTCGWYGEDHWTQILDSTGMGQILMF